MKQPPDELILQNLGAAAMLCWAELPLKAQSQILDQANDMIGLTHIPGIRGQIVGLLVRHHKM